MISKTEDKKIQNKEIQNKENLNKEVEEDKENLNKEAVRIESNHEHEILDVAMQAGQILLENGAEIFRVEETIERICKCYGIYSDNTFVLSNGIFTTAGSINEQVYAKVQHIPVSAANLERVAAINQLSREIQNGCYSIEEVKKILDKIQKMPGKSKKIQILASGIGSACFCYLFGGSIMDSIASFMAGCILYYYILNISTPYLSKIVGTILGSSLVTFICVILYNIHIGENLNNMIIGSIIPMIPGVPFTNGIRDIFVGDYIAGTVRMLDAILVIFCIAMGVGLVINIYHVIAGGILL